MPPLRPGRSAPSPAPSDSLQYDPAKRGEAARQLIADADRESLGVILQELPSFGVSPDVITVAAIQAVPELGAAAKKVTKARQSEASFATTPSVFETVSLPAVDLPRHWWARYRSTTQTSKRVVKEGVRPSQQTSTTLRAKLSGRHANNPAIPADGRGCVRAGPSGASGQVTSDTPRRGAPPPGWNSCGQTARRDRC